MARPRSPTTRAAIALAAAITVPYLGLFAQSVRAALDPASVPEELLRDLALLGAGSPGAQAWVAFSYLAAALGAATLTVLLLIVGLALRRPAAREAAFAVFGVIGLVAALAGAGGLLAGAPTAGSWLGVATSLACGGVLALLALKGTATDFELAEMARRRPEPGG